MIPLLVIGGPTASGKTALSVELAKERNGEIICADSMQVYKYMDIGTAKPTEEEKKGVPHHLFSIVEPNESFSVAKYAEIAHAVIEDIHSRGKLPIMVGGTGLYIDTVANNIKLSEAGNDDNYCKELRDRAEIYGNDVLYSELEKIDPRQAKKLSPSDLRRIIRALEIYKITGITKTEHDRRSKETEEKYLVTRIGIEMDRNLLYDRINKRVDIMIEEGLADEVKELMKGISNVGKCTTLQGIGYKEMLLYLEGHYTLDEAIETIKKRTRNYAKRQLTWFRRCKDMEWLKK